MTKKTIIVYQEQKKIEKKINFIMLSFFLKVQCFQRLFFFKKTSIISHLFNLFNTLVCESKKPLQIVGEIRDRSRQSHNFSTYFVI